MAQLTGRCLRAARALSRLGRGLPVVCVAWLLALPLARAAEPPTEYQLKAVYLFNFGQFVEWPAQSFETPATPFSICIFGTDPFGAVLDQVVGGETLNGRRLQVLRLQDAAKLDNCQILFIGRDQSARLEQTVRELRGRSVLTVTDIEGAEHQGAVISLFNQGKRVRMRINLSEAKANHLVISSKLLRPAEIVGTDGGAP